ncbi:hypothetical protein Gotur_016047, partial [Gossypium turneri]
LRHDCEEPHTDQHALLAFKHQIIDSHNILANSWTTNNSVCNWAGVSCAAKPQRVRVLDLSSMGLIGTIPPQLGNLSFLVSRNLSHNNFQGHFPRELGQLSHLKLIDLSFNFLNGKIPSWFGRLDKVLHLNLRNNNLTGVIPPSIANLDLNFNLIHGNIPHEISKFLNLRILRLAHNQLSGSIPAVIYNISSLLMISVPHNHLSGSLPKDIGNLTELKKLLLYDNNLEGEIPQDIRNLQKLEIFDVRHCPWDLDCSCDGCRNDCFEDLNEEIQKSRRPKNRRKSTQSEFYERWIKGDPNIGPLGEDNGKFVYLVDYSASKSKPQPPKVQNQPPTDLPQPPKKDPNDQQWLAKPLKQPCYKKMSKWVQKHNQFQQYAQEERVVVPEQKIPEVQIYETTSSYEQEFPPLEEFSKKEYLHASKISSKLQADAEGRQVKIVTAEATLNWQTENALAQNSALKKIDLKREKEIQNLKEQIKTLEEARKIPSPQPLKNGIELFPSIKAKKKAKKKKAAEVRTQKEKALGKRPVEKEEEEQESPYSSPPRQVSKSLMIQKEKQSCTNHLTRILRDYNQESLPKISVLDKTEESPSEDSASLKTVSVSEDSETSASYPEQDSEEPEVMATIQPEVKIDEMSEEEATKAGEPSTVRSTPYVSRSKMVFTLDNIPTNKWPERL